MTERVTSFPRMREQFIDYVTDIAYATMVTVDRTGRPRARVLVPIWEVDDAEPVGWLATYKTPVKAAHLANNPHTTLSYWSPRQNAVHVDAVAEWIDEPEIKRHVWDRYRSGSPPGLGYDPLNYWRGGPKDPTFHVIRLEPWRIQIVQGSNLYSRIWQSGR